METETTIDESTKYTLTHRPKTEVYVNTADTITICQEDTRPVTDEEGDDIVALAAEDVPWLVRCLRAVYKEATGEDCPE